VPYRIALAIDKNRQKWEIEQLLGEKNRKRYLKIGNMSKESYGILKKEVNQNSHR